MTRVLQLRRGTAARNNNFVGMPGEITMDTDANAVRIHDGATLGGIEIARADMSNVNLSALESGGTDGGSSDFDIGAVSAEFWDALFREHNLATCNFGISENVSIANVSYIEYLFDTLADADISKIVADMVLVNQVPEAGYAIGDIVHAFGIGSRAAPRPIVFKTINGLFVRQLVNNEAFWASNKTTGATVPVTNSNWKIKFRVWY